MAQGFVRIIKRPAGQAPAEIRDKWIGLVLPVIEKTGGGLFRGLITGQPVLDQVGGYVIRWSDAMNALASKSLETKKWWEKNVYARPHPPALIFDQECCEIVPDQKGDFVEYIKSVVEQHTSWGNLGFVVMFGVILYIGFDGLRRAKKNGIKILQKCWWLGDGPPFFFFKKYKNRKIIK